MSDIMIEAIGWAYADCCITLDKGGDPRKTEMPDVLKRAKTDLLGNRNLHEDSFKKDLCSLFNRHGIDTELNIADYELAKYMIETLDLFRRLVSKNEHLETSEPH